MWSRETSARLSCCVQGFHIHHMWTCKVCLLFSMIPVFLPRMPSQTESANLIVVAFAQTPLSHGVSSHWESSFYSHTTDFPYTWASELNSLYLLLLKPNFQGSVRKQACYDPFLTLHLSALWVTGVCTTYKHPKFSLFYYYFKIWPSFFGIPSSQMFPCHYTPGFLSFRPLLLE